MKKIPRWQPLLDYYKIIGIAMLLLIPWIFLIHEGSHYLVCEAFGAKATYDFFPPSVYCKIQNYIFAETIIGSMAPYIIALLVLLFVKNKYIRLTVIIDTAGNWMASFINQGDFANVLQTSFTWYIIATAGALIAVWMFIKWQIEIVKYWISIKHRIG